MHHGDMGGWTAETDDAQLEKQAGNFGQSIRYW
jgi:hypothetical protein